MILVDNMKNKLLNKILSVYLVLRYIAMIVLIYLIVGTYTINSYGILILIYYVAVNYIAVKYGIIKEFNKRDDISKKDFFLIISVLMVIFNLLMFLPLQGFEIYEVLIISVIPAIEFYFIKTKKEKQKLIDIKTKEAIDQYFKIKK